MPEMITFRFLNLPKELRFIIYENLSISTKQLRLIPSASGFHIEVPGHCDNQAAITITIRHLPVQLLSTCQLVHSEALPFLSRKLDKISETIPRISIDADSLCTPAFSNMQRLLCALLDDLNHHPSFSTKSTTTPPPSKKIQGDLQYPKGIHHWLTQTTHVLLSQRPTPCPLSGFMGTLTHPTVRLIIEVPKSWRQPTYRGIAIEPRAHNSQQPVHTASITSMLSQMWSELADYTKGLKDVKASAIVFGQVCGEQDGIMLTREGLVVTKVAALDFGVCGGLG